MSAPSSLAPSTASLIHDNDTIVHANDQALSLFTVTSRFQLVGRSLSSFVVAADRSSLAEQFETLETGAAPALGLRVTLGGAANTSREVVAVSSPVVWDGAERIQTSFIDPNAELPSGLPAETMGASPVGITIADATEPDEPLVYANDEFVELTGYPREEILGRNCRFLQGEKTSDDPVARMRAAIDTDQPVTVELRNYRKDGSMFWNRVSICPVTDADGTVTHLLGYQEDISERKLYQQEKTLFERQADILDKTVIITDADGIIEYVNPQFERSTGYSAEEAIGRNPRSLTCADHDEEGSDDVWGTLPAGKVWEAELTNKRKSGERYRVEQKIFPVTNSDGEITNYVAIEEDITDEQFVEEVLEVMNRVLRHNVRNAVQVIEGTVDALDDEETAADIDQAAAYGAIRRQAQKLDAMSERTRQIRQLFHRRHEQQALAVTAILDLVDQYRDQHPSVEIALDVRVDDDTMITNANTLRLALGEALDNAVIHNDADDPRVAVTVRRTDTDDISIDVADNGPGIPDAEWEAIASGRETPLVHGSGIGMWLMYWIVTALGGTMELGDNEPRGSIITFRVPSGSHTDSDD